LHPEALYEQTGEVLEKLSSERFISDWYLAGGTALAVQLGHRKSVDLDFFTRQFPQREELLQSLTQYKPKILQESAGTLDLMIEGVQVSFMEYSYRLLGDFVGYRGINMAGIEDIGCMKISAISSRGSKKDYIDLYFILQKIPLEDLLNAFSRKYQEVEYSKAHIMKSLVYFDDAEEDPEPDHLIATDWSAVKKEITGLTKKISTDSGL
jgi:predicted nucleotidyltransferase component of viral defense system